MKAQVQNAGRSVALGIGNTTPAAGPAGSEAVPSDSSITPSISPVNQRGFSEFEVAGRVNNGGWRRFGRADGRLGAPGQAVRSGAGARQLRLPRALERPRAGTGEPNPGPAGRSLAAGWRCHAGTPSPHPRLLKKKNGNENQKLTVTNKGVPEGTWGM